VLVTFTVTFTSYFHFFTHFTSLSASRLASEPLLTQDFFQSQVGGVGNIALSYNERGQFKGIATIIFKNNKSASLAVEKYNGAPIDGGSSKLKLELIIDPTKKPLTSRIAPNAVAQPVAKSKAQALKARVQAAKARQGAKSKTDTKKKTEKPKKAQKPKKVKKTVEELDREMLEYFNN
jgi:THO complex subunit 4